MPTTGGDSQKVAALERIVNRFGAYLSHLVDLSEDPRVKSADRQKLQEYISWKK